MLALLMAAPAAAQLGSPASAQERFDLRDWKRKPLPDSPTILFECNLAARCGEGSIVSGRLLDKPRQPVTVERQKQREAQSAKRMREQSSGRIKEIVLGETRETKVESLTMIVTDKRIVSTSGTRYFIDGVMIGKTKIYSLIASGAKAEQVRNNFTAYALVAAVVLDHLATEAEDDEEETPKPAAPAAPSASPPATPAPAPTPPAAPSAKPPASAQ
jgi:hypothetical protein